MARRLRLDIPGVPWHIVQRGNNRSDCFLIERDYHCYLDMLTEFAEKQRCAVHAYVLMTNHVHLLVSPEDLSSGSILMKLLGQRYVQYFNRMHQRSGTLWEGRFHSCLTQSEEYLLTCYRYIELNPGRAGIVDHPRAYRWSSYRCNAEGEPDVLVTPHAEFSRLGATEADRHQAYRGLFADHLDPARIDEIRRSTNGNAALGSSAFQARIGQILGPRAMRGRPGRRRQVPEQANGQLDLR